MKRIFRGLPEDKVLEDDQLLFLEQLSGTRGSDWDDLLQSDRILIISEAGVGKTHECQAQAEAKSDAGEPAFYIELATLSRSELHHCLSHEDQKRFDTWKSSQSEIAIFFLDSIDELQLTQGSFRSALISLSRALEGNLGRAKIIITSRPVPFDRNIFEKYLPIPETADN